MWGGYTVGVIVVVQSGNKITSISTSWSGLPEEGLQSRLLLFGGCADARTRATTGGRPLHTTTAAAATTATTTGRSGGLAEEGGDGLLLEVGLGSPRVLVTPKLQRQAHAGFNGVVQQ